MSVGVLIHIGFGFVAVNNSRIYAVSMSVTNGLKSDSPNLKFVFHF
jgi:hypothetical protein